MLLLSFPTSAHIVASAVHELYDAVPTSSPVSSSAISTPPTVSYRCRAKVTTSTTHTDCAGTLTIGSDTLTFTAADQIKICTTTITASTKPAISYSGLDCNILIECLDVGGSPIMSETTTSIKVRHEPELVTVRDPAGNFTTYNGYVMVRNSTIDLSDKIRINSTDYSPKRIEPQYWLDGTEAYRIVYF